ncbi:MAG: hypothetical protein JRC93_11265 [Deltaproteobacteria bacterium]|nr:hypothetical protein [Deltaproteobacteria bacterium]
MSSKSYDNNFMQKGKRGRTILALVLVFNSLTLIWGIYLSTLEDSYNRKMIESADFDRNHQALLDMKREYIMLVPLLGQLRLLHKMGEDKFSENEKKIMKENEKWMHDRIASDASMILKLTYLLFAEPTKGKGINTMFEGLSVDERVRRADKYYFEDVNRYVKDLQSNKATIRKRIGLFRNIQFLALIISSLLVLLGTVYLYQYENLREKSAKDK